MSQKSMVAVAATFNKHRDECNEKRKNEWKERQEQRLKTRGPLLGEKIEKLTKINAQSPNSETFANTSKKENGIYLDLPLVWDKNSSLKKE